MDDSNPSRKRNAEDELNQFRKVVPRRSIAELREFLSSPDMSALFPPHTLPPMLRGDNDLPQPPLPIRNVVSANLHLDYIPHINGHARAERVAQHLQQPDVQPYAGSIMREILEGVAEEVPNSPDNLLDQDAEEEVMEEDVEDSEEEDESEHGDVDENENEGAAPNYNIISPGDFTRPFLGTDLKIVGTCTNRSTCSRFANDGGFQFHAHTQIMSAASPKFLRHINAQKQLLAGHEVLFILILIVIKGVITYPVNTVCCKALTICLNVLYHKDRHDNRLIQNEEGCLLNVTYEFALEHQIPAVMDYIKDQLLERNILGRATALEFAFQYGWVNELRTLLVKTSVAERRLAIQNLKGKNIQPPNANWDLMMTMLLMIPG